MTEQQWPIVPTSSSAPTDSFTDPAESSQFSVLIEETIGSGESQRWRIDAKGPIASFSSRQLAQQAAEDAAHNYSPSHPMMPQGRQIFRINPDSYLVIVEGMTVSFHYRVSVAELIRSR